MLEVRLNPLFLNEELMYNVYACTSSCRTNRLTGKGNIRILVVNTLDVFAHIQLYGCLALDTELNNYILFQQVI